MLFRSILHIYSIKYLFFLHFLLFPSLSSSLEPSHRPNTNPKSPTPINPQSSTTITSLKIQIEIPNHTENPNSKSKPHKKSRHLNPIINDSHCLDPQRHWSSRPRPHTKTPWHQRRRWSCPSSNKLCPPCPINSPSPSSFPNGLLDQRG